MEWAAGSADLALVPTKEDLKILEETTIGLPHAVLVVVASAVVMIEGMIDAKRREIIDRMIVVNRVSDQPANDLAPALRQDLLPGAVPVMRLGTTSPFPRLA